MKIPDLMSDLGVSVANARAALSDAVTPCVRLGVTGLSRSGKTVFITGLVRCLTEGGASPPFRRVSELPGFRAYLEPQPNDELPRFAYEDHLKALSGAKPTWPDSTRQISQLRLTIEWQEPDLAQRVLRFDLTQRLHIDIVDYPGEWLGDLAMVDNTFAHWSQENIAHARSPSVEPLAKAFLDFVSQIDLDAQADEHLAIKGAGLYRDFLQAARNDGADQTVIGPGRFLLPGDLDGSPLLTFFPLDLKKSGTLRSGTLGALLARRYESYKTKVAIPFFQDYFSRLDRQVVLLDVLTAINGGADGLRDLDNGLDTALRAFRPGRNTWLSRLLGRRIDRIIFAATKADHLHPTSHDRLQKILQKAVERASSRAQEAGADFRCLALSALRSTEAVDKPVGDDIFHCVRGIPQNGETIDKKTFDGKTHAIVFPGDLPRNPLDAFDSDKADETSYRFIRFQPPRIHSHAIDRVTAPWPHINMDRVVAFLLEDDLP